MDAKRLPDGSWTFREFRRQLAATTPPVAYVGLPWSWTPRIWHPQGHLPGKDSAVSVEYTSPSLPPWLQWKDDALVGSPPPGAESCDIIVEARVSIDSFLPVNPPFMIPSVDSGRA